MFKISFKTPYKKLERFGSKVTKVTINGDMIIPDFMHFEGIFKIMKWAVNEQKQVSIHINGFNDWHLTTYGIALKSDEDVDNPVLAERIAEARAKLKMYKFMCTYLKKVMRHFYTILYGNAEIEKVIESHTESPVDCLHLAYKKYKRLYSHEYQHLNLLISES